MERIERTRTAVRKDDKPRAVQHPSISSVYRCTAGKGEKWKETVIGEGYGTA